MNADCPFCDYAGPNTILWETPSVYVVEPLRAVTPGHLLVIPQAHAEDFVDDPAITAAVYRGAAEYVQSHGIEDCNLITSRGLAASQTINHVHVHILPRTWDDSVRLPWNNPHESPEPAHHLYRRAQRELAALQKSLYALRVVDRHAFEWEADEAIKLVGQAGRYLGKPGEVLFCNWSRCLHAVGEDRADKYPTTDWKNRAIPMGEGAQWYKGRVHADCLEAIHREDAG